MDSSIDWFGTAVFVAIVGALGWLAVRSQLPRVVRLVAIVVSGLLLAVTLWNIVVVLTMPPR